jgi:hypothetical protein
MLEQFFFSMRVAWVAGQISTRHRLEKYPHALAYRHPLEQKLFDTLNSSKSGVFVHWGVYESGKSTAVREAAWRLQEVGRQVIHFHGFDFSSYKQPEGRLRRAIGVPADMDDKHLSDFFLRDTTIIIDHFDTLMRDKDESAVRTLELVRDLIKESETTRKFNVLIVVNSWERAQELVGAGCQLVPSDVPARWTREQLETLFATLPVDVINNVGDKKDTLLRLATLSGTPGFLVFEANCKNLPNARYAAMHDLEWRKGIKALYEPLQELPSDITTMEGRFPDRNGNYHHKDVFSLLIEGF